MLDRHSSLEILEIARRLKGSIDILLTEVVVAELRGPGLARNLAELHQGIQIIYVRVRTRISDGPLSVDARFSQKSISFCNAGGTA